MLNRKFFIALLAMMATLGFAGSAMASSKHIKVKSGVPIPGTMTATSSAFETGLATKLIGVKTWIGVQEHIRIQKVPQSACQHFSKFYNSDYVLGQTSKVPQMYVDYNGYLCRDKYSPTGWVKRGGGHTGADCGNISQPIGLKPKYKVIRPPSIELKSSSSALVKVRVTVSAKAESKLWCGDSSALGSASDTVMVKYSSYESAKSSQAKLNLFLSVAIKAADKAHAKTKVKCTYKAPAPVKTAPVTTTTAPVLQCTDTTAVNYGQAGICVYQTNSADQNCKAAGGSYNGNTNLCTITQVNANCSTVYVINGSGNVVGSPTQSGNCDTNTTTPPPAPTPPTVSLQSVQEVDENGTDVITATVNAPSGDSLNVCYSAQFGAFSPSCVTITAAANQATTVQSTYQAPNDIVTENVTATVYDETTGLNATSAPDIFPVQSGDPSTGRPS
jgi:hypothetical protein